MIYISHFLKIAFVQVYPSKESKHNSQRSKSFEFHSFNNTIKIQVRTCSKLVVFFSTLVPCLKRLFVFFIASYFLFFNCLIFIFFISIHMLRPLAVLTSPLRSMNVGSTLLKSLESVLFLNLFLFLSWSIGPVLFKVRKK